MRAEGVSVVTDGPLIPPVTLRRAAALESVLPTKAAVRTSCRAAATTISSPRAARLVLGYALGTPEATDVLERIEEIEEALKCD
jgi:hypothetical protein